MRTTEKQVPLAGGPPPPQVSTRVRGGNTYHPHGTVPQMSHSAQSSGKFPTSVNYVVSILINYHFCAWKHKPV